jgi:hypothetical protein
MCGGMLVCKPALGLKAPQILRGEAEVGRSKKDRSSLVEGNSTLRTSADLRFERQDFRPATFGRGHRDWR